MSRFIDRLSRRQQQWLWFIVLWCGGLGAVLLLSAAIRLLIPDVG
jgi:hypothetical protein